MHRSAVGTRFGRSTFCNGWLREFQHRRKWRLSGAENQTVWEFLSNGSVLVGEVRGRYKFGDQDRLKIETPFATTVYLVKLSSDQMILQEPGGPKLEFTKVTETGR